MDEYPEAHAPKVSDLKGKEPFSVWWARVGSHYPHLPRNVARQWLYRHWGHSEYRGLPSGRLRFELRHCTSDWVAKVQIPRDEPANVAARGAQLVTNGLGSPNRYRVASIMVRKGTWPAPPIVLDNRKPITAPHFNELPQGFVLIEGHRRLAIAHHLHRCEKLAAKLPVWLATYTA